MPFLSFHFSSDTGKMKFSEKGKTKHFLVLGSLITKIYQARMQTTNTVMKLQEGFQTSSNTQTAPNKPPIKCFSNIYFVKQTYNTHNSFRNSILIHSKSYQENYVK